MKNMIDFHKTVETGVDLRLVTTDCITCSVWLVKITFLMHIS